MDHDIFFDCPQCSHTIKVSSSLIGVLVECPDCDHSFKVPDIRDGLNPRLRRAGADKTSRTPNRELNHRLERLEEGVSDFLNHQTELLHDLKFLEDNARIVLKQLELLMAPQPLDAPRGCGMMAVSVPPPSKRAARWLRWSRIFGWLTLGISLGIGLLLLREL